MDTDRTWAEVDLNSIVHNLGEIRRAIPCSTRIMGVVKADGYGHGSVRTAKTLGENGVDYLAVATAEEAMELRQNDIKTPILCLGYTDPLRFPQIVDYDITQTIYSLDIARHLSKTALLRGRMAKVHLKVDTGMNRIGFLPGDSSLAEIEDIVKLGGIFVEGIFSHLSCSEMEDTSYSDMQFQLFKDFYTRLEKKNIRIGIKHISNSGAIIGLPHMALDMVRAGLMIYGCYPGEASKRRGFGLKPALSLKSRIIHIKDIPPGTSVSYGRKFISTESGRIATVAIGYADGYPRILSCLGRAVAGGQFAPVVGNICMDQMIINITGCDKDIKIGDEVVLIGTQGENTIGGDEVARLANTINYEILTGIGKRVPRIYNVFG